MKKKNRPYKKSTSVSETTKTKLECLYKERKKTLGDIVEEAVRREYAQAFDEDYDPGEEVEVMIKFKSPRGWWGEGEVQLAIISPTLAD